MQILINDGPFRVIFQPNRDGFCLNLGHSEALPGDAISFKPDMEKWAEWPAQSLPPVSLFPDLSLLRHQVLEISTTWCSRFLILSISTEFDENTIEAGNVGFLL